MTYPYASRVDLVPGPDGVRVAHRLTVEHGAVTLVLILTALVACYDGSS